MVMRTSAAATAGRNAGLKRRAYHYRMAWEGLRATWAKLPAIALDAGLALVLGGLGMAQLLGEHHPGPGPGDGGDGPGFGGPGGGPFSRGGPFEQGPGTLTYVLLALCAASLLPRSRWPWASLAGVSVFGAAFLYQGENPFSILLIVLVAIYSAVAASTLPRVQSLFLAVGAAAVLAFGVVAGNHPRDDALWAMDAAWLLAAMFLGDASRSRRAYATEAELRAAQAEMSHAEEARRHVTEERLQIARELHDVVAHNISLINVQAGVAAHLMDTDPQQARDAFVNIKAASHETLQELRSLVGVLREPVDGPKLAPTVGLEALEGLIQAVREAGQQVEVSVTGSPRFLPSTVDVSAYRILQEALTNAVKHAPQSRIAVHIDYGADKVTVEVQNDGPVSPRAGAQDVGGFGLIGMRERVQALGGRLEAGPDRNGGFTIRAELPLPGLAT
jgi:signal transduction histidine kinase